LICWGKSQYGQSNVPEEFANGSVQILSGKGFDHFCAASATKLKCWGRDNDNLLNVPGEFANGSIV